MSEKEKCTIDSIKHLIGAFREIRLLGVESFFRNEVTGHVIEFGKAGVITRSLHLVSRYVVEASLVTFVVGLIIYLLHQSESVESIYGLLTVFAVGALRLVPSFSAIGLGFANIRTATYALNSLYDELQIISDRKERLSANVDSKLTTFESLDLKDVSYVYKSNVKHVVLERVCLSIKKGEFVALSGKSGSGKSTLMDLLTGMLSPTEGNLILNSSNNLANSSTDMSWWQSNCAYIPQTVFLINSSIKNNIALGLSDIEIDFDRLNQAIIAANLVSVFEKNSMNLDSQVGEGGAKLSGGQRQRVALARALYAGREIIFMDEATSALDKETEDEVMVHMESLRGKITIILITHSQSALKTCDQVFHVLNRRVTRI
jgi:ABC-type bacteriocin/lantibiotic exporter with double-glycine peptidase domain